MATERKPQTEEAVSLEERSRIISEIFEGVKQTPEFQKAKGSATPEDGLLTFDWLDRQDKRDAKYFGYRKKDNSERLFFTRFELPRGMNFERLHLSIERDNDQKSISSRAHQEGLGGREMFDNSRALLEAAPIFIQKILPSFTSTVK